MLKNSVLTENDLKELARIVIAEVTAQQKAIMQEEFDARYHDVKLLMKNYRMLKAHYTKISPEVLEVNSICSLRHKTVLMMSHVDKMLSAYQAICKSSGRDDEQCRWKILEQRFISEKRRTIEEISTGLSIDRRTYFRCINRAFEDLAVLLFGIEAIGTWKPNIRAKK